ncbi:hypothetical protein IFR04_014499 [Cadophora malorum]|uniref:Uncharacterized protein n=1 Tax=Cadophora malorum TaxID=108018 RepID=A0A8H7W255_9HELO|nr:hypothetical protein IFR04_014499 [Cadophora malorum]
MASKTRDIIMSERIITDGPSLATDVDAAMMDEMAACSTREDTAPAPASIMDDTTPTGDIAPSNEDTSTSTIGETIPGIIRLSTPIDGPTGQLSEDTAPASIMNDTAPTGDLAPSSEDVAPASIIEDTIPGGIHPSTPIDGPTGQLSEDTVEAAASAGTIEETIPSGVRPSTPIDGLTGQLSDNATEAAALANIIQSTITGDIETSICDEAPTHVNVVDLAFGKATVDEDSAMVAMDEDAPIIVEKTGGEEVRVVSVSTGNVDHDTIIVEEEVARFELDEEGTQTILIEDSDDEQIADIGDLTQPIVVDEFDDEQIDELLDYICDIVGRSVSDEDMESEYSDDNSDSGSPRQFSRSSRL